MRKGGKRNISKNFGAKERNQIKPKISEEEVVGMRLNKYVAHCGICSRRQAAELVSKVFWHIQQHLTTFGIWSNALMDIRGDVNRVNSCQSVLPELQTGFTRLNLSCLPDSIVSILDVNRGKAATLVPV